MLILDVETTGVDPKKHSIVSIGALEFEKTEREFYGECRMWNGAEISEEALGVNGFTREQIVETNIKSHDELLQKFSGWLTDCSDVVIAGENPWFDRDFLNESFARAGLLSPFGKRCVDLHSVCCAHKMNRRLSLLLKDKKSILNTDSILEYVGLPRRTGSHNALEDAKLEAEAFSRLIHGLNLFTEFSQHTVPAFLMKDLKK